MVENARDQSGFRVMATVRDDVVPPMQAGATSAKRNHNAQTPLAARLLPPSVLDTFLSVLLYIDIEGLWHIDLETENLPEVFWHDFWRKNAKKFNLELRKSGKEPLASPIPPLTLSKHSFEL